MSKLRAFYLILTFPFIIRHTRQVQKRLQNRVFKHLKGLERAIFEFSVKFLTVLDKYLRQLTYCFYTGLFVPLTFTFLVSFPRNSNESSMCTGLLQCLMFSSFCSFKVMKPFEAKWVFFDTHLVTCVKFLKSNGTY